MALDSGLHRNEVQGIMLCPDIFELRLKGFYCALKQLLDLGDLNPPFEKGD